MQRSITFHALLSILVITIVLALGWFATRLNLSFDVTANDRNTLSPASVRAVESLTTPVDIIAVLGPVKSQRDAVTALIARFQAYKPDLSLQFVNPETDPAAARELNAAPEGELILRGNQREQRLQTVSERSVVGALRQLAREGERQIRFITGHDERSPTMMTNTDWGLIAEHMASIGYVSEELSLVSEPQIGEQVDLLVIAAPVRPYFPGEIASLTEYLSRGGNLLWMQETPMQGETGAGLERLSTEFGIDTLPGVVIDTASQTLDAASPDFVLLDRFPAHPATAALANPVLLPQAQALAVTPLAGQDLLPLLQTPESSWTETGTLKGEMRFDENSAEVAGPLMLGVTIERKIDKKIQRIAVLGDADFAASQFLGNGGNKALAEALLVWLAGDIDALAFVTTPPPDSQLNLGNKSIVILSAVLLVALPLALLTIALTVRLRRRAR
ncbi:MAG: GldG family protein [Granulosicoccus sp.]